MIEVPSIGFLDRDLRFIGDLLWRNICLVVVYAVDNCVVKAVSTKIWLI